MLCIPATRSRWRALLRILDRVGKERRMIENGSFSYNDRNLLDKDEHTMIYVLSDAEFVR